MDHGLTSCDTWHRLSNLVILLNDLIIKAAGWGGGGGGERLGEGGVVRRGRGG